MVYIDYLGLFREMYDLFSDVWGKAAVDGDVTNNNAIGAFGASQVVDDRDRVRKKYVRARMGRQSQRSAADAITIAVRKYDSARLHIKIEQAEYILMKVKKNCLYFHVKRSKRSLLTLHMGHLSGGESLAQRYPHTLHRHTG
jgi:hypothetical protein